jgi:hypothetical protein
MLIHPMVASEEVSINNKDDENDRSEADRS